MTDRQQLPTLESIRSVWLVGIKGTGMTPVAQILHRYGKHVAGSDVAERFFTDPVLESLSITVKSVSAGNITKNINLLIYSIAYKEDHEEIKKARELGIQVLSLPEALGWLMQGKTGIAVTGTHGKTTTTAILGFIMQQADLDPTVVVGAPVPQFDGSALVGGSQYFVLEADEYQNKFQHYSPTAAIITNIEYDHPDAFPDRADVLEAFTRFAKKIPAFGFIVANVDDVNVQKLTSRVTCEVITFGSVPSARWRIERDQEYEGMGQGFVVYHNDNLWARGETKLLGMFNLLNILGAIVMAVKLNIGQEVILRAVSRFQAPQRRLEVKGTSKKGSSIIDDFAHHPTELQVTLKTIREMYSDKKITAIFCPHTFSRTKALFDEFSRSFKDVDQAIILDIYGSTREQEETVTAEELVAAINKQSKNAKHIASKEEALAYVQKKKGDKDVVITLGAGDIWKIADKLVQ